MEGVDNAREEEMVLDRYPHTADLFHSERAAFPDFLKRLFTFHKVVDELWIITWSLISSVPALLLASATSGLSPLSTAPTTYYYGINLFNDLRKLKEVVMMSRQIVMHKHMRVCLCIKPR